MVDIRSLRRPLALAGVVVAGVSALSVASVEAASTGGVVHAYLASTSPHFQSDAPVILTGAINDSGVDHQDALRGGNVDRIVLSKGGFWLDHSAQGNLHSTLNPKTCFVTYAGKLPVILSHGTGAYASITGTLTATVGGRDVLARTKAGKCNTDAEPVVSLTAKSAVGTIRYR